jgi:hypothetical protein
MNRSKPPESPAADPAELANGPNRVPEPAPAGIGDSLRRLDLIRETLDEACSSLGLLVAEQRHARAGTRALPRAEDAEPGPAGLGAQVDALRERLSALEADRGVLRERLDDTTARLEAEMRRAEAAEESVRFRFAELADLEKKLSALRTYGQTLERSYAALLGSTTWRVMEPVRFTLRMVKRSPKPKPFVPRLIEKRKRP